MKRLEVDAGAEETYEKIRRGRSYFDPRQWVWGEEYGYDAYGNCYAGRFRLSSLCEDWDEWLDDDYEDDDRMSVAAKKRLIILQ